VGVIVEEREKEEEERNEIQIEPNESN